MMNTDNPAVSYSEIWKNKKPINRYLVVGPFGNFYTGNKPHNFVKRRYKGDDDYITKVWSPSFTQDPSRAKVFKKVNHARAAIQTMLKQDEKELAEFFNLGPDTLKKSMVVHVVELRPILVLAE